MGPPIDRWPIDNGPCRMNASMTAPSFGALANQPDSPSRRGGSPMPEYLAPGVYVEEIERGPKPIEGVATSTAAFLGATERGPSRPRLVTSYSEYLRCFRRHRRSTAAYMPYAVNAVLRQRRAPRLHRPHQRRQRRASDRHRGRVQPPRDRRRNRLQPCVGPHRRGNHQGRRQQAQSGSGCGSTTGTRPGPDIPYDRGAVQPGAAPPGPEPSATEDFDDLSLEPASPSYFLTAGERHEHLSRRQLVIRRVRRRCPCPGVGSGHRWIRSAQQRRGRRRPHGYRLRG